MSLSPYAVDLIALARGEERKLRRDEDEGAGAEGSEGEVGEKTSASARRRLLSLVCCGAGDAAKAMDTLMPVVAAACEGALRMRVTGRGVALAWRVCGECPAALRRALETRCAAFVEAYNDETAARLDPRLRRLPRALAEDPRCGVCGAETAAALECPHCAEADSEEALFVCSQACLNRVWVQHRAEAHGSAKQRALRIFADMLADRPSARRRRARGSRWLTRTARCIVRHVGGLVFFAGVVPLLVYLATLWAYDYLGWSFRKQFGWGANMLQTF